MGGALGAATAGAAFAFPFPTARVAIIGGVKADAAAMKVRRIAAVVFMLASWDEHQLFKGVLSLSLRWSCAHEGLS